MGKTIRDAVEEYLASRGDLRPTTAEGYSIVAEERVYGPYGDLPACELDGLDSRASKLLLAAVGWMAERDAGEFVDVPVKGVADCTW